MPIDEESTKAEADGEARDKAWAWRPRRAPEPIGASLQLKAVFSFLTRLPVAAPDPWPPLALARGVWAFPIVGMAIGGVAAVSAVVASILEFPAVIVALLAVSAGILATGALHEDGLADVADGFGGGATRETRLTIMKDSRIGTFGAVALLLSVALRVEALAALVPDGRGPVLVALVVAHGASRSVMPVLMWLMPLARIDGLAAATGRPRPEHVLIGLLTGIAITVYGLGRQNGFIAILITAIAVGMLAVLARRKIGGYTGDVLGAAQQLAEMSILLATTIGIGS